MVAFDEAAALCRGFAQQFVIEEIPTTLRFDFEAAGLTPNNQGLIKYLGGRLLTSEQPRGVEPMRARKYLWIDGKIPLWINLRVHAVDGDFTFIEVHVCDRVSADDRKLYYTKDGVQRRRFTSSVRRCLGVGYRWS
jgi:hypothetical protein